MVIALTRPQPSRSAPALPATGLERVTVVHLIPEYHQALVHTSAGIEVAITPRTPAVVLADLRAHLVSKA
jgi:hypothetical protein